VKPPQALDIDPKALTNLERHEEEAFPHLRSLLIVKHGHLVFERYFQSEYGPEDCHELASAVKSFVSALAGVALQQGILDSLDQRLVEFFPEYVTPDTDPQLHEITLRHLLTMTSCLVLPSREETDRAAQGDEWVRFVFRQQVSPQPRLEFAYKPDSLTLSWVLARAGGTSLPEFAAQHLFAPLGIAEFSWTPPNWAALKPRDMAKLGYLYLDKGQWENKQVIPAEFVEQSTREQVKGGHPEGYGYGYYWWIAADQEHPAFYAGGFGGQYIYVVPTLDAVVVTTSKLDRPHLENRRLIMEHVVPLLDD